MSASRLATSTGCVAGRSDAMRALLVTFDPAQALLEVAALVLRVLGSRADIHAPSTLSGPRCGITAEVGRKYIARCASSDSGPKVRCPPRVEVQLRRVLQAWHDRLGCNALFGLPSCRSRIAAHSSPSLSKKQHAALVSPPARQGWGTPAGGVDASRSLDVLARLFRRASSRSKWANSVCVQRGAFRAKAFTQKSTRKRDAPKVDKPRAISWI
ncbi:hypothetical protein PSP20601_04919 [Pandoraea sputorum]|nr:hypothetical protein PSP20601_04919 [Pandoraea sputorum]